MAAATVYVAPRIRGILVEILVKYYKLDVKLASVDEPEFEKNFPLKKVPALVADKGYKLHEIIAVIFYLLDFLPEQEREALLAYKKENLPQVLKWLSFANSELLPNLSNAFGPLRGSAPYNKKQVDTALEKADANVAIFEERLTNFTYLVGERQSLADVFAAVLAVRGFNYVWGKEWIAKHPVFVRWFKTVLDSPILKDTELVKDFKFIETPLAPPQGKKKEKAPKAAAPAAAQAAPAAKKEEQPAEAPAKKPKHPLEALGKPTIPLDEWKRTYSNEDTREKALPYFWDKFFNEQEWSLWKVDYKYNDELTLTFMSNNLVGGFFNRLTGSSKYIFGSMVVYGENNNNGITGAFLVRGQDHVPAFDVAPDWESYSFKKLDPSNPEDKAFVNNSWAWDEPIVTENGEKKEIVDGKVCK